ncbi:MAG TPA: HEAT repeat domain-containing protein, partial [Chthoniobacteraceae bacterium]
LKDPAVTVRIAAANGLGALGETAAPHAAAVADLLAEPDPAALRTSAGALSRMGSAGAEFSGRIAALLDHEDPTVSSAGASALRTLGKASAASAPAVAALLQSPKPQARISALSVLEAMGEGSAALGAQITALQKDPEPKVRSAVTFVLAEIGGESRARALSEMLRDRDADVRCAAAYNLGRMGAAGAAFAPALAGALDDEDLSVRITALGGLGQMGSVAPFADRIGALQTDARQEIREAAADALATIDSKSDARPAGASAETFGKMANALSPKDYASLLDDPESRVQSLGWKYLSDHGNADGDFDVQATLLATIHELPAKKVAQRRAQLRMWSGANPEMQRSVTWLGKPDMDPLPKEGLSPEETRTTLALFEKLWTHTANFAALRTELAQRIEQVANAKLTELDEDTAKLARDLLAKSQEPPPAAPPSAESDHSRILKALAEPKKSRLSKVVSGERETATRILGETRMLDAGVDQYAIEFGIRAGTSVEPEKIRKYIRRGTRIWLELLRPGGPRDVLGHSYAGFSVDSPPIIPRATYDALKDVADWGFWGAYCPPGARPR